MPTTVQEYGMLNSGAWGDRIVSQTFWMNLFNNMLQNGVVVEDGTEAQLSATTPAGMSCKISNFDAVIEGVFYTYEEDEIELTFDAPDAQPRYDLIVLKLDRLVDHDMELYVLKGTAAASPIYPSLTRTDDGIYEIALWAIPVDPGDVVLDIGNAVSLIADTDYCGLFDLNYRAVASGTIIPYSTDYTYYDPSYYNLSTPAAATWANCPKWTCKSDDYIVGVYAYATPHILIHNRSTDTTTYKSPVHATYTLSTLNNITYSRPILVDDKVIIPHGRINVDTASTYKRLLIYDISGDSITYSSPMPVTDTLLGRRLVLMQYDGDVYVVANKTSSYDGFIYKYEIATDTWTLIDTLTMKYTVGGADYNYGTFIGAIDETTGIMYLCAHAMAAYLSTYSFVISTTSLTKHVSQIEVPMNKRGDSCSINTNSDVYYFNKVLYFMCLARGDYGYYTSPTYGTTDWQATVSSTYGIGAINVETGVMSSGPIYSLGRIQSDHDRIFLDETAVIGLSQFTNTVTTLHQNKIVYINPMPILGTGDRILLGRLNKFSTDITFKNFTTGQGYLNSRDTVPIAVADQYGCSCYDKTLADYSKYDDVITFNLEVIGAN